MKKLFLLIILWALTSSFAHATQHLYVSGSPTTYWDCNPVTSTEYVITGGDCTLRHANGNVWVFLNNYYSAESYFDISSYFTAEYVGNNLAAAITYYTGAPATVVVLDPEDAPYIAHVRIDIDDSTVPVTIGGIGAYLYDPNYAQYNPWEISFSPLYGYI